MRSETRLATHQHVDEIASRPPLRYILHLSCLRSLEIPRMSRLVLGINSAHADSSAVLVGSGGMLAGVAEERINRKKHCAGFPRLAVQEVLKIAGATLRDVTDIAVARDLQANLAAKLAFVARHPKSGIPRAIKRFAVHKDV